MVSQRRRRNRTPPYIKLVTNLESTTRDPLDLLSTEVGNDRPPLADGGIADGQRPSDIRGVLEVIDNVLFKHRPSLTVVQTTTQPQFRGGMLTSVHMDHLPTLAERLADAMKEQGVSKSELARSCKVSPVAVGKWLKGGNITADNLAAAGRALGVRDDWIRTGRLPRARDGAAEERQVDEIVGILQGLREPLAALAIAIDKLGSAEPAKRRQKP